jgi:hypothetical protein
MSEPQGWVARLLAKLLRPADNDRKGGQPQRPPQHSRQHQNQRPSAMVSPWRIYRICAKPPHLLMRNERGKVVDLGVVSINALQFDYSLSAGNGKGEGFASLSMLLDDVAGVLTSSSLEAEFKRLPDCGPTMGEYLDTGAHLDISMPVAP